MIGSPNKKNEKVTRKELENCFFDLLKKRNTPKKKLVKSKNELKSEKTKMESQINLPKLLEEEEEDVDEEEDSEEDIENEEDEDNNINNEEVDESEDSSNKELPFLDQKKDIKEINEL